MKTGTNPVLLISPRHRRELSAALEAAEYETVSADTIAAALDVFAVSTCRIVVLDARADLEAALSGLEQLGDRVEARRGALIALVRREDSPALSRFLHKGATHFVLAPVRQADFLQSVLFAQRHVDRLSSVSRASVLMTAQAPLGDLPHWEWRIGGRSIEISPQLGELLELPQSTRTLPLWRLWSMLAKPERRKVIIQIAKVLTAGLPLEFQHKVATPGARARMFFERVRPILGRDGSVIGVAATVEDLALTGIDTGAMGHFDPLTGLASQTFVRTWLSQQLQSATGFAPKCAVLVAALNRFDQFNSVYGRNVGDATLQAVARRLRRTVLERPDRGSRRGRRNNILLSRLAGAEFAVVLPGPMHLKDAVFLAQEVIESFTRPFIVDGHVIHVSLRIGIATAEEDETDPDQLLRHASAALQQAKAMEPNSFQVFVPGEADVLRQRAVLESDLRRAVANDELTLLYQPQVDISTGVISGVEALIRWHHPTLGMVDTAMLLRMVEDADLHVDLGETVLRRALRDSRHFPEGLRVSVNVDASQLRYDGLEDAVLSAIEATGANPNQITLELTEGALIANLDAAFGTLTRLRGHGIRIAIDDFGTGYSSLGYLKSLPIDYVKIDRIFVTGLGAESRDSVVVAGVIDMARSLGMAVVAEGVETEDQLDRLARAGCNYYQGFLCSVPLSVGELADFMAGWHARHATSSLPAGQVP